MKNLLKINIKKKITQSTIHIQDVPWKVGEKIFIPDRINSLNIWKKDTHYIPHSKEILSILASGSIIALSLVAPNVLTAFGPIVDSNDYNHRRLKYCVGRLKKLKLVKVTYTDGNQIVAITEKGKIRALQYKINEMQIKRPKRWDGKWRIIIFDIPEQYKKMRDLFRRHLKQMDFYQLQKSVWVHPFACLDEIEFLRQIYHVGIQVIYIEANRLEGVEDLLSHYDLH
jgi:hypothetical protein